MYYGGYNKVNEKRFSWLDAGDYSGTYEADAGHVALDFTNTLSNRLSDNPHDWLSNYGNLVAWGELTGVLSDESGELLRRWAKSHPDEADQALARAVDMREACYRILSAAVVDSDPQPADIDTLNKFLAAALVHLQIAREEGDFKWTWNVEAKDLDRIVWLVIWATADLLNSELLGRVGECQGDGCGWLFLDTSRNRSRRWCSMAECGNRAKSRRHYARSRSE
jgi:predicted RNA-binding Zn ribbon-like protein